ncbi:MAG: glycoside hydrolase family 15 protein [Acetobacteraceae bacterium]
MSRPIGDYGLIGDGETAALVSRDGAIDWLCLPRFDSDSCLAALLGDERHGSWRIAPAIEGWRSSRRYRPDTLILETEFARGGNAVRVTDFMPIRDGAPAVVRIVTGLGGQVDMRLDLALRFDYGLISPWMEAHPDGSAWGVVGPDLVVLRAPVPLQVGRDRIGAAFTVSAGQSLAFTLVHGSSNEDAPPAPDAARALAATEAYWRGWIGRFDKPTHWPEATRRSLITLHALTHRPTGGLLAAPTTSLPEAIGGKMNWDYRYCWLRDATFAVGALLNAGYHEEARAWRDWMLRAVAGQPDKLRIMYRVDGGRHLNEWEVKWLPGYENSRPVHVGNKAADQEQTDVFGELIDAMSLMRRAGIEPSEHARATERALLERLEQTWPQTGHGFWENRGDPLHYTYSKVMAWAGVDRFLRGAARDGGADAETIARLTALRDAIHDEVCEKGFDKARGYFVERYGGHHIDASLLLLAPVGFLPVGDPRMAATIEAIARDLTEGGLVLRKPRDEAPDEGAFLPCACWLADVRAMQGRHAEARSLLERVLSVGNDLGLLSEEYDTTRERLCGNFPQALTHLGVLNTTLGLSGPVLQRAGG